MLIVISMPSESIIGTLIFDILSQTSTLHTIMLDWHRILRLLVGDAAGELVH